MNEISPLKLTHAAVNKFKNLIKKEKNQNLKLRIYIIGGGCSGFKYGFILDENVNHDDFTIEIKGISLVIDFMSLQYITGGIVDYKEELQGSRFVIINPNAKITCSCGSSFSI